MLALAPGLFWMLTSFAVGPSGQGGAEGGGPGLRQQRRKHIPFHVYLSAFNRRQYPSLRRSAGTEASPGRDRA